MFRKNMATIDRLLRAFVVAPGALAGGLVLGAGTAAGIVLLVVAAVMAATSAVGSCPLYTLLRVDTRTLHRGRGMPLRHA